MWTSSPCVVFLVGMILVGFASGSELTLVRKGVGLTGHPVDVSGTLDLNGNGVPELLVERYRQVSLVEEATNPRGYREIVRLDHAGSGNLVTALSISGPGIEPALLLCWLNGPCELRRHGDFQVKATVTNAFRPTFGDVDGDGQPEIVANRYSNTLLLDPMTLAVRASFPMDVIGVQADILGDARNEIVAGFPPRAFSISRNGDVWTASEVWNSGLSSSWGVLPVPFEGRTALVLHDGLTAMLATFGPEPTLRTIESSDHYVVPIVADANHDGQVDLITADAHTLRAVGLDTGALLWERNTSTDLPRLGAVERIIAYDLDDDGAKELVWSNHASQPGVVAISMPPVGSPRWRSDFNFGKVLDHAAIKRSDGTTSIAYVTAEGYEQPRLGAIGFLDATTLDDESGSAYAWWPGFPGVADRMRASGISAFPQPGEPDGVVVVGSTQGPSGNTEGAWLWYFDGNGEYRLGFATQSSLTPQRIVAAQVLDRPERQLVVAGWEPPTGPTEKARVEVIDAQTGNVLWQSTSLPAKFGTFITQLAVADLDGDGDLEAVVAFEDTVAVFTPSQGPNPVVSYPAGQFALLDRGQGQSGLLAILALTDVTFYEGTSVVPVHAFELPEVAYTFAVFADHDEDAVMFAVSGAFGLEVRRYPDGAIVATHDDGVTSIMSVIQLNEANGVRIFGMSDGFRAWRYRSEQIFQDGFDGAGLAKSGAGFAFP